MTRPVRVLHIVGAMDRAGTETWLMSMVRKLDRTRLQMDFVKHVQEACSYDNALTMLGSGVFYCGPASNPLLYALRLARIIREHGPYDAVHAHMHHFNGFALLLSRLASVPVRIAHSHSDTTTVDSKTLPQIVYRAISSSLISACASHKIAVSEQAAAYLFGESWQSGRNVALLYPGIDLSHFEGHVDRLSLRNDLGIGSRDFVLGHVGRFVPAKNHSLLLRIHSELVKIKPGSRLLLVGKGPLQEQCMHEARQLGIGAYVHFLGERSDVANIMRCAMDAFAFPSLHEGLGLAAVEAQAAGLPTFVSDRVPWEVDTGCGLVTRVPFCANPREWAHQIIDSITRPHISQREALVHVARSRFNLSQNIERLERLYSHSDKQSAFASSACGRTASEPSSANAACPLTDHSLAGHGPSTEARSQW